MAIDAVADCHAGQLDAAQGSTVSGRVCRRIDAALSTVRPVGERAIDHPQPVPRAKSSRR